MSQALLPMMLTVAAAIGVYYLCSEVINLPDSISMTIGVLAAILCAVVFAGLKGKKES